MVEAGGLQSGNDFPSTQILEIKFSRIKKRTPLESEKKVYLFL